MAPSKGLDSELESFRQQWLSEVRTKHGEPSQPPEHPAPIAPASPKKPKVQPPSPTRTRKSASPIEEDEEHPPAQLLEEDAGPVGNTIDGSVRTPQTELVSALDHYEEAMAKEAEGNMGDSLKLYRRAYRLDNRVDRRYREKHFPQAPRPTPTQNPEPSPPAPASAQPVNPEPAVILPIKDLIASFSNLQIEPAPPEVEGAPPPPCPIASLPSELLIHIAHDVAAHDVGDFARLSLVCKSLAYLVATEQRIWRDVALGSRFGFTGMHYHWTKTTGWTDVQLEEQHLQDGRLLSTRDLLTQRLAQNILTTKSLIPELYASWKHMFRSRPRIRFNGCYISTVNYIRMGQASTNQATWGGSPVHIVTYYRYLRFFRDGTAISLLTTLEPSAVVAHLSRDMLRLHRDNTHAYLPSAVMQKAYKARWRLSSAWDVRSDGGFDESEDPREGELTVETETHDPKYMFRMDLSLRTAGKGAKNNKFVWRGHFSYNRLTDDWAQFTLKHDKAFFFSRVRSYGMEE